MHQLEQALCEGTGESGGEGGLEALKRLKPCRCVRTFAEPLCAEVRNLATELASAGLAFWLCAILCSADGAGRRPVCADLCTGARQGEGKHAERGHAPPTDALAARCAPVLLLQFAAAAAGLKFQIQTSGAF